MKLLSRRRFGLLALSSPLLLLAPPASASLMESLLSRAIVPRHDDELWVLVEDREAMMSVYRGNRLVERFEPVSLGRGGARPQRQRGDRATPLGEFRVNRFNRRSKYPIHIF